MDARRILRIAKATGTKTLITFPTTLTLLVCSGSIPLAFIRPPTGGLGQEAQNVQLPVRLEQAVQFVGQTAVVFSTVQTPDELKY